MIPRIKFARPWIGIPERRAVAEVLGEDTLTNGPEVEAFEREFAEWCGGGHAVAVSSCMAALHICHMILGWKQVQLPALTHVAAWHAAHLTGCKVGGGAKSVVHYLGHVADVESDTLEDCALAIGSRYRDGLHVGLHGIAGCFSFYPCKHMTTGEGGMILTRDEGFAFHAKKLRHFGQAGGKTFHIGLNYRMTEVQAAIGRQQIRRLGWFLERRKQNAGILRSHLKCYEMFPESSTYAYALGLDNRDTVRERLAKIGIETSVYYSPLPPLTPPYRKKYRYKDGDFPEAEAIEARILCLPIGPHVTPGEADWMGRTVRKVLECG